MKINIIKEHSFYELGDHEVTEERGNYLIRIGVAEEAEGIYSAKEIKEILHERKEFKENRNSRKKKIK